MKMKLLAAGAAVALSMAMAGAANATVTVFTLTVDTSSTGLQLPAGQNFGTVTVTDSGSLGSLTANQLLFSVDLNDPTYNFFVHANQTDQVLLFNLAQSLTAASYSFSTPAGGVVAGAGTYTGATTGTFNPNGAIGTFNQAVLFTDTNPPPNFQPGPLVFTITGSSALTTASLLANSGGTAGSFAIAADIINTTNGNTGWVGATAGGGGLQEVPEPGTWALMIMGFGGVGALLRRRKTMAAA